MWMWLMRCKLYRLYSQALAPTPGWPHLTVFFHWQTFHLCDYLRENAYVIMEYVNPGRIFWQCIFLHLNLKMVWRCHRNVFSQLSFLLVNAFQNLCSYYPIQTMWNWRATIVQLCHTQLIAWKYRISLNNGTPPPSLAISSFCYPLPLKLENWHLG